MSNKSKPPKVDAKDGFDLLDYPCDFAFKAMCRADSSETGADYIKGLLTPMLNDGALLGMKSNVSRTGKFESVTATVHLKNREELEAIYRLIAQSPRVVMTL